MISESSRQILGSLRITVRPNCKIEVAAARSTTIIANCVLFVMLVAALPAMAQSGVSFTDNFSSYSQGTCFTDGSNFGPWTEIFGNYPPSNCVQVLSNGNQAWLDENPLAATSSDPGHSSLVVGPSFASALTFSVSLTTVEQLRQGSPNPWEVAWVLWHYTAKTHFYYFIAKPNGWELGKEDPAYPGNQRFLATGSLQTFPIGHQYNIEIVETAQHAITVYVGNQPITTFRDTERPYTSGRIKLYTEDAHVQFENVSAISTPGSTVISASGPEWASTPFGTPQTASFTAEMDATPLTTAIDGGIGLSNGPQAAFTGLACIGRFDSSGFIDARNGGSYTAVNSIPYTANQTYHFRFVVSLSSHTYSLYVTPPGQSEQTVALNYAFRTEQQSVTVLNAWSVFADVASMQVANFIAPSATAAANSTWANNSFATQNSAFEADWDAIPTTSGMDGVMGLSNGPQTDFTGFATLVRFYSGTGTIQARNGGNYASDISLSYTPGLMYHFRLLVNVSSHTYSVYVTPSGGGEQLLASSYAFRTEQTGVSALNNVGILVDSTTGSLLFGNFAISGSSGRVASTYDQTVLADRPVAFWDVNGTSVSETDLTPNGNNGKYIGGALSTSTMPNGDTVNVFDGSRNHYLSIPSNASFSIPTTGNLTWEAWIRPDVLQFPISDGTGDYVDFMGKCATYGTPPPTCEWESRMYDNTLATPTPPDTPKTRCNRLSAYVFNPSAGQGAAADWQEPTPACSMLQAGEWLHVVGEYTTDPTKTPANCTNGSTYPGTINIWVNGVLWNQGPDHGQTGCMGQVSPGVVPVANSSPLNIGTMATDTSFEGAIGKVAIYNYLLTQSQINNHYQMMTGKQPTGSCGSDGTCSF